MLMKSLPTELHCLPHLKKLGINNCGSIQSLPTKGLPCSLQELTIRGCSEELAEQCRQLVGVIPKVFLSKEKEPEEELLEVEKKEPLEAGKGSLETEDETDLSNLETTSEGLLEVKKEELPKVRKGLIEVGKREGPLEVKKEELRRDCPGFEGPLEVKKEELKPWRRDCSGFEGPLEVKKEELRRVPKPMLKPQRRDCSGFEGPLEVKEEELKPRRRDCSGFEGPLFFFFRLD